MTQRIYRTANGKQVDMGALLMKNEDVRAVGNMGVNAKGDVVDDKNTKLISRNEEVNKQYRKQISNQIGAGASDSTEPTIKRQVSEKIEGLDDPIVNEQTIAETPPETETKPSGGLASAIAKARQVEQTKLKTPREEARSTKGVKKI